MYVEGDVGGVCVWCWGDDDDDEGEGEGEVCC